MLNNNKKIQRCRSASIKNISWKSINLNFCAKNTSKAKTSKLYSVNFAGFFVYFYFSDIIVILLSQFLTCPPSTITLLALLASNQIFKLPFTSYSTASQLTSLLLKVIQLYFLFSKILDLKIWNLQISSSWNQFCCRLVSSFVASGLSKLPMRMERESNVGNVQQTVRWFAD